MKTTTEIRKRSFMRSKRNLIWQVSVLLLCLAAINGTAQSHNVTNCTEAALRTAMAEGGTVTFACDGTITLADTITIQNDTVLDGSGHNITISGGNVVRVFYNSANASLTLVNVTIADGSSTNGAGIFNDGGQLILSQALLQSNIAWNSFLDVPQGGGIFNAGGVVEATNCSFLGNAAAAEYVGINLSERTSCGGAILNAGGELNLESCHFTGNSAFGNPGIAAAGMFLSGADGSGGAIYNSGTLNANNCTFLQNSAMGGKGGNAISADFPATGGGEGSGGAIFNAGVAAIMRGGFNGNSAVGGVGGTALTVYAGALGGSANGGAICNSGDLQVESCAFFTNRVSSGSGGNGGDGNWSSGGFDDYPTPGASGGWGGAGNGGAICNFGSLIVRESVVVSNSCAGAPGGNGGSGGGFIVPDGSEATTAAGNGGLGGGGNGGALFNGGTADLINDTLAFNTGTGMRGGNGGHGGDSSVYSYPGGDGANGGDGGPGYGCIRGSAHLTNCTVAFNSGFGGTGGAGGTGGTGGRGRTEPIVEPPGTPGAPGEPGTNGTVNGGLTPDSLLVNSILASNVPNNCSGSIFDIGHNLSSDNSCAFTNVGSLNNTDPMLGPLADNGGPTLTMALMPGSPAIDAGNTPAAPSTDQRGFPRPVGPAADIGAYELCYIPVLQIGSPQTGTISVLVYGLPGQSCRLLASDTFANWLPIATNLISPSGTTWFQDNSSITQACRFYRVVTP